MDTIDRADAYALLTDGRCVHVRSVTPEDWQAVYDFAATLGQESLYHRFFSVPAHPGERLADALCSPLSDQYPPSQGALIALLDGTAVGLAEWYRTRRDDEAEIAFEVSDALQGHGVATLLAEHLMLAAQRVGVRRLTAVTQGENQRMLGVFLALGIPVERDWEYGECTLTISLDPAVTGGAALLDAEARREAVADEASLRALFAPDEIAVFGAAGEATTEAVLRNLAGFAGPVHVGGVRGEALPRDARPGLVVITAPPDDVVAAARRCAESKVKAVVVTAVGVPPEQGRGLLRVCHEAGMRLVGPGSLGVAAPGGANGFSALLSNLPPAPGDAGVAVQSGGVGLALLGHLGRLGVGVSTFAAVGEKYDVSANDVLVHWERDPATRFGLLHVESFGNPRKFARTARRLSRRIPLLAVDPEQSPSQARTALYEQAGIIALPSLGALVDAAALTAHQPVPRGRRVAVVGTTHGMVSLTVQACTAAGLEVTEAVNLTPAADEPTLAAAISRVLGTADSPAPADAVVIAVAPTVPHALDPLVAAETARADAVVLAVVVDQAESVTVLRSARSAGRALPSYADAADAARALSALVRAAEVTRRPPGDEEPEPDFDTLAARKLVEDWLRADPAGRELTEPECADLLEAIGLPVGAAADARATVLTAWQDPVFGPLLSGSGEGEAARTLLVPFGAREAAELVGSPVDAAVRLSALFAACPELATLRVTIGFDQDGAWTAAATGAFGPARLENPYLRRLRRAPVE